MPRPTISPNQPQLIHRTWRPTVETLTPTEITLSPTEEQTLSPTEGTLAPTEATLVPTEETLVPTEETWAPSEETLVGNRTDSTIGFSASQVVENFSYSDYANATEDFKYVFATTVAASLGNNITWYDINVTSVTEVTTMADSAYSYTSSAASSISVNYFVTIPDEALDAVKHNYFAEEEQVVSIEDLVLTLTDALEAAVETGDFSALLDTYAEEAADLSLEEAESPEIQTEVAQFYYSIEEYIGNRTDAPLGFLVEQVICYFSVHCI